MAKHVQLPKRENESSVEINFYTKNNEDPLTKVIDRMENYGLKEFQLKYLEKTRNPEFRESSFFG
ncbi:hypothetical protein K8Q96_01375 [Candidatus Nomurabacteria bacterium]|nr:hypothetical protein [Candidatus Nomurabacteria bacterium]